MSPTNSFSVPKAPPSPTNLFGVPKAPPPRCPCRCPPAGSSPPSPQTSRLGPEGPSERLAGGVGQLPGEGARTGRGKPAATGTSGNAPTGFTAAGIPGKRPQPSPGVSSCPLNPLKKIGVRFSRHVFLLTQDSQCRAAGLPGGIGPAVPGSRGFGGGKTAAGGRGRTEWTGTS